MGKTRRLIIMGVFAATAGLSSCGADPADGNGASLEEPDSKPRNSIAGDVREWAVETTSARALAGDVTFAITNFGTMKHEFLVVKTTYEHGKIPLGANNRFDEEDKGLSVVDEIPEWAPGVTNTLKVKLEPGKYELLCNIEGHYKNGMHAAFEVIP